MKKRNIFSTIVTFLLIAFNCAGCSSSGDTEDVVYLHVYNWADYIYQNDPENDYTEPDMVEQFETYVNTPEMKKNYGLTKDVKVIYDTLCPSDYMIQKLALNLDGLESTRIQKIDFDRVPNYKKYASNFLIDNLKNINIDDNDVSKGTLNDYAVGYMWGTLGLLYNPGAVSLPEEYTTERVIEDFSAPDAWNVLWNDENYSRMASIKDSIRDTYSMGIMHVYNDEFKALQEEYESGALDKATYKKDINKIFNRSDSETIKKVQEALIELKGKIYGFEVDTGKTGSEQRLIML